MKHIPFSWCIASLSRIAQLILFIGLPYIGAHLTALALLLHRDMAIAAARYHALVVYTPQVETLICSLAIIVAGAAAFDLLERKAAANRKP